MSEKHYPTAYELRNRQDEEIRSYQLDTVFEEINNKLESNPDIRRIEYYGELWEYAIEKLRRMGYKVEKKFIRDPITDLEDENDPYYIINWEE